MKNAQGKFFLARLDQQQNFHTRSFFDIQIIIIYKSEENSKSEATKAKQTPSNFLENYSKFEETAKNCSLTL